MLEQSVDVHNEYRATQRGHAWLATQDHNFKLHSAANPQTHCFKAFTAKHFTTVCAAFALTLTSLPKAMRLPAFLAGLCLVLIMHTPGMTNFPVFLVSAVASSARASKSLP